MAYQGKWKKKVRLYNLYCSGHINNCSVIDWLIIIFQINKKITMILININIQRIINKYEII